MSILMVVGPEMNDDFRFSPAGFSVVSDTPTRAAGFRSPSEDSAVARRDSESVGLEIFDVAGDVDAAPEVEAGVPDAVVVNDCR